MAEGQEIIDIPGLTPLKILGRRRRACFPPMSYIRHRSRSFVLTTVLMSRMQPKNSDVFQFILFLIEDRGELALQKKKIHKTLQASGWEQVAHAEHTTCDNIDESDPQEWTVALYIGNQSFQLNDDPQIPPDLRGKNGRQNFFEVFETRSTDCITRPLQIRVDLLSRTGKMVSILYKEEPLSYGKRFFTRMGVVNPHSLSLLLEIERRAAENVMHNLWGKYDEQQAQIVGRWMKMSESNDSLALQELLERLRPVDFVSRRGQKHVKRLQELEKSQIDKATFINELKLILVDCLVEIGESQDEINMYVSFHNSCTRMLRERGVIDQTLQRSLEYLITQPSHATSQCIPVSQVAQAVNKCFNHRETDSELELNGMQGFTEEEIQDFMKELAEMRKQKDAIQMITILVEILSNLCLKNREALQISKDKICKHRRRVNLDGLLKILYKFFRSTSGRKLRARIDQLADLQENILKSKINFHFFDEDATLVILELLSFAKSSFSRFAQFELQDHSTNRSFWNQLPHTQTWPFLGPDHELCDNAEIFPSQSPLRKVSHTRVSKSFSSGANSYDSCDSAQAWIPEVIHTTVSRQHSSGLDSSVSCGSTQRPLREVSHTRVSKRFSAGANSCASCGSVQSLNVYCNTTIYANGEHVVNSIGDSCNVSFV